MWLSRSPPQVSSAPQLRLSWRESCKRIDGSLRLKGPATMGSRRLILLTSSGLSSSWPFRSRLQGELARCSPLLDCPFHCPGKPTIFVYMYAIYLHRRLVTGFYRSGVYVYVQCVCPNFTTVDCWNSLRHTTILDKTHVSLFHIDFSATVLIFQVIPPFPSLSLKPRLQLLTSTSP